MAVARKLKAPVRSPSEPLPSDLPLTKASGQTLESPLFYWSELVRELMELHLEAGKALARELNGNAPTAETVADLRRRLDLVRAQLDNAEQRRRVA